MSEDRPIVCIDLDGVLNTFDEWRGADHFHDPRPGSREFLERLNELGYRVVVFTTRWAPHVGAWLTQHGLSVYVSEITDKKPPAIAFIDDRAICFRGDYDETLSDLIRFRTHWASPEPD